MISKKKLNVLALIFILIVALVYLFINLDIFSREGEKFCLDHGYQAATSLTFDSDGQGVLHCS